MNKLVLVLLVAIIGCNEGEGRVKKIKKVTTQTTVTNTENKGTMTNIGTITAINWTSLDIAKKEQGLKNLPLMIDFYADWCVWCKMYDKITFKDEDVIKESLNFIPAKIDCTKDKSIAQQYGVLGFPTIVFEGTSGTRHSVMGFRMPKELILEMKKARKKF